MSSDGLFSTLSRQFPKNVGLLNGVYDISLYSSGVEYTSFGEQAAMIHRKLFGKVSSNITTLGAEGYVILLNAMNRCEDPADHQCVNTMLHNTDGFEGVMGRITIQANGDVERPLIINRVIKGRESFMVKVY